MEIKLYKWYNKFNCRGGLSNLVIKVIEQEEKITPNQGGCTSCN